MIKDKDIIEQYIRDLKSISYWSKKIIECNLELEDIAYRMQGKQTSSFYEVVLENGSSKKRNNYLECMEEERMVLLEKQGFINRIKDVEAVFEKIENEEGFNVRKCMIDMYVLNKRHEEVVNEYCYTRQAVYKKIYKAILSGF